MQQAHPFPVLEKARTGYLMADGNARFGGGGNLVAPRSGPTDIEQYDFYCLSSHRRFTAEAGLLEKCDRNLGNRARNRCEVKETER